MPSSRLVDVPIPRVALQASPQRRVLARIAEAIEATLHDFVQLLRNETSRLVEFDHQPEHQRERHFPLTDLFQASPPKIPRGQSDTSRSGGRAKRGYSRVTT